MTNIHTNKHSFARLIGALLLGTSLLSATMARADSGTVTNLGTLGGTTSNALGIAGDGIVVGKSLITGNGATHAYVWTQGGGMVDLGTLGGTNSDAYGVSTDGSVIVGSASTGGGATHAFRWTQGGGMVDLGTLGGGNSFAWAVSEDGSVIAGQSQTGGGFTRAMRWTQAGGMVDLGTLGGTRSQAWSISRDGTVLSGASQIAGDGAYHVFRWTQGTGMVDLGTLGGTFGRGLGISNDGNIIVGFAGNGTVDRAFRWTQGTGMVDLGVLGGTSAYSSANDISGDGEIIVGSVDNTTSSGTVAFYWTQDDGMQDLNEMLTDVGVDLTGITLQSAVAISEDGEYIAGDGSFSGNARSFLVRYVVGGGIGGVTTGSAQQDAVEELAQSQQGAAVENRATANEMLGMTRAITNNNYMYGGGMFGSAVGYLGGQYSRDNLTVLGGIGYGALDFENVTQDNAFTVATAVRYTFGDVLGHETQTLRPYAEVGGWVAPSTDTTFSRTYANGAGKATGRGTTDTTSWAGYGRGGVIWDATDADQVTAYGELGRQSMHFDSYSEALTASNPFPASVDDGSMRMMVARAGFSYTHDFENVPTIDIPVSLTLAGAVARSFAVDSGLETTVDGIGTLRAGGQNDTWGEFGARLEGHISDSIALNLDLNGTTGVSSGGTALHGGVGVVYKF